MMFPKPTKIRSKKITQSAKGKPCTLHVTQCSSRETVVFCHAPSYGKGIGTKSDDFFGAYGCSECHRVIDQMSILESAHLWLRAINETQKILFNEELIGVK